MRNMAKPFLKWAGGKRQLISEIENRLPADIDECTSYVEPFIGGGAVLFHLLQNRSFEEVHISDLNPELILCYRTLQEDAKESSNTIKMIESYPSEQEDRNNLTTLSEDWNNVENIQSFQAKRLDVSHKPCS